MSRFDSISANSPLTASMRRLFQKQRLDRQGGSNQESQHSGGERGRQSALDAALSCTAVRVPLWIYGSELGGGVADPSHRPWIRGGQKIIIPLRFRNFSRTKMKKTLRVQNRALPKFRGKGERKGVRNSLSLPLFVWRAGEGSESRRGHPPPSFSSGSVFFLIP